MPKTDNSDTSRQTPHVAVVIPCYREREHVLDVLSGIDSGVENIFVIDDACPDGTGDYVRENCSDERIEVMVHERNTGVGGATVTGYRAALDAGADIVVKLDGDGQMDPSLIGELILPIANGGADYTKGNRLHRRTSVKGMPPARLFGNMGLTLFSKLSSGYWSVMDPTNGFTAIHSKIIGELPLDEIAKGYFFESDMLYRLSGIDAVVRDVPMQARYGNEESHLSIRRIFWDFLCGYLANVWRRIVDTYVVRDPGLASIELIFGLLLLAGGTVYGAYRWWMSIATGVPATAGTAIVAAVPIIIGVQLLLAFIGHDTRREPTQALHPLLLAREARRTHTNVHK